MIESFGLLLTAVVIMDFALSATRASLMNARSTHLFVIREQQPYRVDQTLEILARPRLRSSLRTAMILVHMFFAILIWIIANSIFTNLVVSAAVIPLSSLVVLLTTILILIGEYALEGRILLDPERWSLTFSPLAATIDFLFTPISALIMSFLGTSAQDKYSPEVTEADLKNWVEAGQPQGSLEKEERQMIYSIFRFGETLAREIMVPRIDMIALDINATLVEAITALSKSGHSRLPVYEDTIDNVVGVLYAKDLLGVPTNSSQTIMSMRSTLRKAYFVPEAKKVDDLLTEMQTRRVHMAVVVDEYGGVAGLVTLEDIMEEIIGEIQDEYDQSEEMLYQQITPDEYMFHGRIDLNDFNDVMGTHLEKESTDTLGGFIYGEIGQVPVGGESIEADGVALTVEQVSARRIRKVRASRIHPTQEMEIEKSDAD